MYRTVSIILGPTKISEKLFLVVSIPLCNLFLTDQFASWYSNHTHFSSREGGGGVVREETVESLQGEVDALQTELRTMEGHLRERDKGQEAKQSKIKELEVRNRKLVIYYNNTPVVVHRARCAQLATN